MSRYFIFFILTIGFKFCLCTIDINDIPIIKSPHNHKDNRACEIAICTIFRDEADYLTEWIEFHRMLGVGHFYLYNNMSADNYWNILAPYVHAGVVELFDVPFDSYGYNDGAKTHNFVQVTCYNHAMDLARGKNKWLAVIDADEFVCPVVDENISKALSRYDDATGLAVYWQIYGPSNVWELKPGELMIEKLLYKEPNKGGNMMFKSIVKPEFAYCNDQHWCPVTVGYMLMPNRQVFSHTPGHSLLPVDIIRINHYTYRTLSFVETHKKPRRHRWGYVYSNEEWQAHMDYANSEYDPVMLRFVNKLKYRMRHLRHFQ